MTTIQISKKLKDELDQIKTHPRESYQDVIEQVVNHFKEDDESHLELKDEVIKSIERGRKDFKNGRFYTTKQLRKELGL